MIDYDTVLFSTQLGLLRNAHAFGLDHIPSRHLDSLQDIADAVHSGTFDNTLNSPGVDSDTAVDILVYNVLTLSRYRDMYEGHKYSDEA